MSIAAEIRRRELLRLRREKAERDGLCKTCCSRPKHESYSMCFECREIRRRYDERRRNGQPKRADRPRPRPRQTLTIRGESLIQRLHREARETVIASWNGPVPSASWYGTDLHNRKHRFDGAVMDEFHRLLKLHGITVEGA